MLVLANANRLRVDLHEFRERILQAPRNGNGTAQGDIEVREFPGGKLRGGVNGSTCFRHHDLGHLQVRQSLDQLGRELVGLA